MSERGPEGIGFNESLTRSFKLAEAFRKSGVLGEKSDQESRNIDNEKVREILSTSFPIHYQNEEQYDSMSKYESVTQMVEIKKSNKIDYVKKLAESHLIEIGLALSQNKEILKAATEGEDKLNKLIPSRLHEIHPYILSVILTNGKEDKQGQEVVEELVEVFKLKKKADSFPSEKNRSDFDSKSDALFDKLYERCENFGPKEIEDGTEGRVETIMGYILGMKENKKVVGEPAEERKRKVEREEKREEGGDSTSRYMSNDEVNKVFANRYDMEKDARSWDLSPLYMAIDFKYMNGRMGWRMDTPADWYKKESKEVRDRIDVMVKMNLAAAGLESAGKDLEYVMKNESAFKFTSEQMSALFNGDFKLIMSKMLNDLCELYTDGNGHEALRYKERYYQLATKDDIKAGRSDSAGFVLGEDGNRIEILDNKSNRGKGARIVDKDVLYKLEHFQNYKEELAYFLAEQNGNEYKIYEEDDDQGHKKGEYVLDANENRVRRLTFMDIMNAYTAWNMVYAMGDTSVWDRMRVLPTYNQIISDAIRTLNAEYKARGKVMIEKGGKIKKSDSLFEAEYFSGQMAEWAIKVMELERDLGKKVIDENGKVIEYIEEPLDGVKTFREKVLDREVELLSNKTFYGFLDFVNGGRDLYEGSDPKTGVNFYNPNIGRNEKVTLARLLMNYAYKKTDNKGNKSFIPKAERREFSFGDKTVTFQNEFYDMLDGATIISESLMGKVREAKIEDPGKWAEKIKTAQRMINGIKINGENALLYGRDPNLWRDVIIGTFKCDTSRLSSDHPYLLRPTAKNGFSEAYSKYVYHFLTDANKLNLSNSEVSINELMRLLGVYVDQNEKNPGGIALAIKNEKIESYEIRQTQKLIDKIRKTSEFDVVSKDMGRMVDEIRGIKESNDAIDRMKADFMRISKFGRGFEDYASRLLEAIEREAEMERKRGVKLK